MRIRLLLLMMCSASVDVAVTNAVDMDRTQQIKTAVQKAVPWLQKGAAGSNAHSKCFTCHNHGMPIIALTEAASHGLAVDSTVLTSLVDHTTSFLKSGQERYREGKGQGGQVLTAGYALWALSANGHEPDNVTAAVVSYVQNNQAGKSHWTKSGRRPPSDGNRFTVTYTALRALHDYGSDNDKTLREKRFVAARKWLEETPSKETEDAVFRLKALRLLKSEVADAVALELLSQQRKDGGWAQKADMKSDAYATGSALATLLSEGQVPKDDARVINGVTYLLDAQQDDGTWHVVTRADGFQPYYESGFPYGKDQFISMAASSWAVIALLRSIDSADPQVADSVNRTPTK